MNGPSIFRTLSFTDCRSAINAWSTLDLPLPFGPMNTLIRPNFSRLSSSKHLKLRSLIPVSIVALRFGLERQFRRAESATPATSDLAGRVLADELARLFWVDD